MPDDGRIALALMLGCLLSRSAEAQVYRLAELNIDQIRMLDRQRTVILLPGGVLEEHGPYLPAFTDGYLSQRMAADVARAIALRPGWKALVFPTIVLIATCAVAGFVYGILPSGDTHDPLAWVLIALAVVVISVSLLVVVGAEIGRRIAERRLGEIEI